MGRDVRPVVDAFGVRRSAAEGFAWADWSPTPGRRCDKPKKLLRPSVTCVAWVCRCRRRRYPPTALDPSGRPRRGRLPTRGAHIRSSRRLPGRLCLPRPPPPRTTRPVRSTVTTRSMSPTSPTRSPTAIRRRPALPAPDQAWAGGVRRSSGAVPGPVRWGGDRESREQVAGLGRSCDGATRDPPVSAGPSVSSAGRVSAAAGPSLRRPSARRIVRRGPVA